MRVLIALVLLCVLHPARADASRVCESISTNTEAFVDERRKGYTKNQMKDNARQIANQRQLDKTTLESWYAEIDWIFKNQNLRFGSVKSKDKRYEECMKQYEGQ
jgi:hypothetical protein